jgi:hypothetical protein
MGMNNQLTRRADPSGMNFGTIFGMLPRSITMVAVLVGMVGLLPCDRVAAAVIKPATVIGFDGLRDVEIVDDQFTALGVDFNRTGLTISRQINAPRTGPTLHPAYPTYSGDQVISDYIQSPSRGVIRADAIGATWSQVEAYVTGRTNVILRAFSRENQVLGLIQTGGANYASYIDPATGGRVAAAPTGISPNYRLQLAFANIAYVTFTGDTVNGNSFTLDDFTFTPVTVSPPAVPTPLLLPGLIGLGIKVLRRSRQLD